MINYNIYYFHPLNLTFKSAQTIQVIRDSLYLSKLGYKIYIYGVYEQKNELNDVLEFIKNDTLYISYSKHTKINKIILKLKFLFSIYRDTRDKLLVTRNLTKTKELLNLKMLFKDCKIVQEMHEEAFPHLIKNKINLKHKFEKCIKQIDGVIFTNYSQKILFNKEFDFKLKNSVVLPNGVEIDKFAKANKNQAKDKIILTYLGQFNTWKNVELIFDSLSLLDDKFTLRIAGGKDDKASKKYINALIHKYNINKNRVQYLGFVKSSDIVEKVLNNSDILLLPLGDNIQSKYLTSPMKLFEYMATKIPVLAIDYPSVSMLLENNEIYLSANDKYTFSKQIIDIIEDENKYLKINKMNILVKRYSYENRSLRYNKFISILNK